MLMIMFLILKILTLTSTTGCGGGAREGNDEAREGDDERRSLHEERRGGALAPRRRMPARERRAREPRRVQSPGRHGNESVARRIDALRWMGRCCPLVWLGGAAPPLYLHPDGEETGAAWLPA